MIGYTIKHYDADIFVYQDNGEEFLVGKRRFNFWRKITSQFFQDGQLILETGYDVYPLWKVLSIDYQQLPVYLTLEKRAWDYVLVCGNDRLTIKQGYFKNPIYRLYSNDELQGAVSAKLLSLAEDPTIYQLNFENDLNVNFYLLLFFLINLPSRDL